MAGLKAVLFDFGGTLDSNGTTWPDRFFLLYEQAGLPPSKDAWVRAFYHSDDNLASRFPLEGLGLEATVKLQVHCAMEILAPGRPDVAERILRGFVDPCREHLTRSAALLKRLRGRYKLGIVSNFYGNLESLLAADGLRGLFDVIADSGKVGVTKPEPGIFRHALDRLGVEPSEALMVGDSLKRDMRGAEALGMPHAWLTAEPRPCCPSGNLLRSLDELEPLLAETSGLGAAR